MQTSNRNGNISENCFTEKNGGAMGDDKKSNNPNRVRDHLANERTYLAWQRTALALLGFGLVIVRLRYLLPGNHQQGHGWQLGILFAVVGLLLVPLSTAHYFQVRRAIDNDTYEPHSHWIVLCSAAILLIGIGVLYFMLTMPDAPASNTSFVVPFG
jgi:putative membrane protein